MALMKKRMIFIIVPLLIILSLTLYYFKIYSHMSVVTSFAKVVPYESLSILEDKADLIVIGSPKKDMEEREHHVTYFGGLGGKAFKTVQDFYSVTEIAVQKVLKSNGDDVAANQILPIIEPISMDQTLLGKVKLKFEDYEEMHRGNKYVLFLKKNSDGEYSLMSLSYGKYALDPNDAGDRTNLIKREKIKEEVMKKYK